MSNRHPRRGERGPDGWDPQRAAMGLPPDDRIFLKLATEAAVGACKRLGFHEALPLRPERSNEIPGDIAGQAWEALMHEVIIRQVTIANPPGWLRSVTYFRAAGHLREHIDRKGQYADPDAITDEDGRSVPFIETLTDDCRALPIVEETLELHYKSRTKLLPIFPQGSAVRHWAETLMANGKLWADAESDDERLQQKTFCEIYGYNNQDFRKAWERARQRAAETIREIEGTSDEEGTDQ